MENSINKIPIMVFRKYSTYYCGNKINEEFLTDLFHGVDSIDFLDLRLKTEEFSNYFSKITA